MNEAAAWCDPCPEGTRLRVRVVPNAKRTGIADAGATLRVRLAAPPVEDKANAALLEHLAEELGVRTRDLTLLRGQRGPDKAVRVSGVPPNEVTRRLRGRR